MHPRDKDIAATIEALLDARAPSSSICPSEVARTLAEPASDWRTLMPEVRRVAETLAAAGRLRVTRGEAEVRATAPGGPIRLRRPLPEA